MTNLANVFDMFRNMIAVDGMVMCTQIYNYNFTNNVLTCSGYSLNIVKANFITFVFTLVQTLQYYVTSLLNY